MKLSGQLFFEETYKILNLLEEKQMDNIKRAASIMAHSIMEDGVIHIFGSGHSRAFAMELAYRAGGLIPMNAISPEDLALRGSDPITYEQLKDPKTERNPVTGRKVLQLHDIRSGDVMISCSNSGRNGAVVEVAQETKKRGLPLIAVTSLNHSQRSESRHPSGKKLYEIADVVIDNCGPYGDALLEVEGLEVRVCSISSIANAVIAQAMTAETIRIMLEKGYDSPVYLSMNVDGADEYNSSLRSHYEGRIT